MNEVNPLGNNPLGGSLNSQSIFPLLQTQLFQAQTTQPGQPAQATQQVHKGHHGHHGHKPAQPSQENQTLQPYQQVDATSLSAEAQQLLSNTKNEAISF